MPAPVTLQQVRRAPAFRRLPPTEVRAVVESSKMRDVPAGSVLFEEEDRGDSVFLVLKGTLAITKSLGDGTSARIATRGPHDWLGELTLEDGGPRSASAQAEGRARVLEVPRKELLGALQRHPRAALDLMSSVVGKLRESDSILVETIRKRTQALEAANQRLGGELLRMRGGAEGSAGIDTFIGKTPAVERARAQARLAARHPRPVLIVGEDGTGKRRLALAIHAESPRAGGPFECLDCSLIGEVELEAALLGSMPGSLTGARQGEAGLLEAAHGGSLVLEHVDAIPRSTQGVLFRFLETGAYERLGSMGSRKCDVRVFGTCRNGLAAVVGEGVFRRDLAERLSATRIAIPSLRERRADIPLLARHLVQASAAALGVVPPVVAPSALRVISRYDFPGNVDELDGEMENLVAGAVPGATVASRDLPAKFVHGDPASQEFYSEAVRAFKAQIISQAVSEAKGNRARAAERLGLHRSNLTRMIRELGLNDIL